MSGDSIPKAQCVPSYFPIVLSMYVASKVHLEFILDDMLHDSSSYQGRCQPE